MPPTPTHTSRAGNGPFGFTIPEVDAQGRVLRDVKLYEFGPDTVINTYRDRVAALTVENHRLADLLDGVMADDPAAIRDAAAWLAANRPEVDG
jgi:hypothetical protein